MSAEFEAKINSYPAAVLNKFQQLRSLIHQVADDHQLGNIEETLKWGEPAFLNKNGSTIRIDYKKHSPDNIYLFFNCKTKLVETYKELFFDVFHFEKNRAIALKIDQKLPTELETCIRLALSYHRLKHLTLLGE